MFYEIIIQGNLSAGVKQQLGKINLENRVIDDQDVSAFTLEVKDQAHLCYLMNMLYTQRYVILQVKSKNKELTI